MVKLSSEVLHSIFIQLPLDERLECTLVCRHWCAVIRERSLLFDLEINTEGVFENVMTMVHLHLSHGNQVQRLILTLNLEVTCDCLRLREMFPIARVFEYKGLRIYNDFINEFGEFNCENPIPDTAGVYQALPEAHSTISTLNSWNKLGELEISAGFRRSRTVLFSFLKDMPSLKKLTLRECCISIQNCEAVHQNLPAIETFQLKRVVLDLDSAPNDIVPATSAQNLSPMLFVIQVASPEQLLEIYQDGFLPIYASLGDQLTSIIARNVPAELQLFDQLSGFGCQIQSCRLVACEENPVLTQLAQSPLSDVIQELEIEDTVINPPNLFRNMTNLTMLSVINHPGEFVMNLELVGLLNGLPSGLTQLSITCGSLEVSKALPTHTNNIELLQINCDMLSTRLFRVISNFFPNLRYLYLQGFPIIYKSIFLSPRHSFYDDLPLFSIKYTDGSPPFYYCGAIVDNAVSMERYGTKEFRGRPLVRIFCAPINTLNLDVTLVNN